VLKVDRAIADLRRGQATCIAHSQDTLWIAAVETIDPEVITEVIAATHQQPTLTITAQRATVLGVGDFMAVPVTLSPPANANWEWFQRIAWSIINNPAEAKEWLQNVPFQEASYAAAMAVQLTKFARLLPAVLTVPVSDLLHVVSHTEMPSAVSVTAPADIAAYPENLARSLRRVSDARVPLAGIGSTRFVLFRGIDGMTEHLAVIIGEPDMEDAVLVRLHSACLTGDIFSSLKCDCGEQLRGTVAAMAAAGGGVLLYLTQEGRGIGLANKLRAYQLQAAGYDTLDADAMLGFANDERHYGPAVEMLRQLGIRRVRLMTNNPRKVSALTAAGIVIENRIPVMGSVNPYNEHYLTTKAKRAGHLLEVALGAGDIDVD
jgi:GTP cyclohydrolase II